MRILLLSLLAAGSLLASGKKPSTGETVPGAAEVRTFSEVAPAGGTVQVKVMLTQPHPISSGGGKFAMYDMMVDGVALWSPSGEAAGTALLQNGTLTLSVVSPTADLGTGLDYPFLTITTDIPKSVANGSVFPLTSSLAFDSPSGPVVLADPKPGTLTVAGSLSVSGLWPGGGTWPSGAVITVRGTGFQPGLRLDTKMKTSTPVLVSDHEMRFTLQENAKLDQQPITVTNPDRATVTYYSYLRGVLVQQPSREILRRVEPVFASQTRGVMTVGPMEIPTAGQFTAVAVQNPNPGAVGIMFRLDRTGQTGNVVLPPGGRLMDELSQLLGGAALQAGDTITVNATAGVQMLGIFGNETAGTVKPFLPAF